MEIACDYSASLMTLLETGAVDVNWIKLSRRDTFATEFAAARPIRPVLFHAVPTGTAGLERWPTWTDELAGCITACGSPHVAFHLNGLAGAWGYPPDDAEAIARVVATVIRLQRQLPVPVILENIGDYPGIPGYARCLADPGVIHAICDRTGAGLLLDLAHAQVAACHRGEAISTYLAALPLHLVREIHLNGPRPTVAAADADVYFAMNAEYRPCLGQAQLWDTHDELREVDYRLLAATLDRCSPRILTLEYGGTGTYFLARSDPAAIVRQIRRVRAIVATGAVGAA